MSRHITYRWFCYQHRQHGPSGCPPLLSLKFNQGSVAFLHSSNRCRETPLHMSCQCLFLPRQEIRECVCSRRTQQHSHGNASSSSSILCLHSTMRPYSSLLHCLDPQLQSTHPQLFLFHIFSLFPSLDHCSGRDFLIIHPLFQKVKCRAVCMHVQMCLMVFCACCVQTVVRKPQVFSQLL